MDLPHPSDPSVDSQQDEQGAAELVPRTYVAGLQPQVWAGILRDFFETLEPLLSWVNQVLHGGLWWEVAVAWDTIVANLCCYRMGKEALVWEVQTFLQH